LEREKFVLGIVNGKDGAMRREKCQIGFFV
jgi:hypothetical protein